ncbi:MAG TPA: protein kinase [Vicinamibacterales bacterium]|nr:protein kinase [Vicinamibacterales bacterium]
MPLTPGTRLGAYVISGPIGSGGMGEVYRARDTRLDRDVAIKVLPDSVAADPDPSAGSGSARATSRVERRARFEREARAVAALSHPNILAIHDVGVHEGVSFAVMELLHGETLRDRLKSGPLPVRKATEIAIQIARGLGAAHDKNLIHRDLKPENLFLLADGQVKILDFGLARPAAGPDSGSGATETVAAMTDPGTVMGTVGYMAPEQVRGQTIDARADLFAFGAVLYEMISGQRAFQRDTSADTITAILKEDPPELSGSRADISPALDRIIRHCLEKNPAERFQTARDVAFALGALSGSGTAAISSAGSGAVPASAPAPAASRRRATGLVLAAVIVATAVAAVGIDRMSRPAAIGPVHYTQKTFGAQMIVTARFMPDGQSIVYSGADSGNATQLYEVRAGVLEPRPFGPPRSHLLSISSKGELAILTDAHFIGQRLYKGTLSRMSIEGNPRPWMSDVREADWNPDGSDMAIVRTNNGVDELEYPIGKKLYSSTGYISDPRVSPDGTRVAFMDHQLKFDDRGWVRVVDNAGKVTTVAGEFWGEEGLAWTSDGTSVLFAANDRTNDMEKDAGDLSYQIRSASLARPGVSMSAVTGPADFTIHDVARDGRWLVTRDDIRLGVGARLANDTADRDLSWLHQSWVPSLSQDGSKLLFSDGTAGGNYGVVWRKTDRSPIVRLGEGNTAGLSPDGQWALAQIFTPPQIVVYPMGAGNPVHVKAGSLERASPLAWFPDSKTILVVGNEKDKPPRAYRQALPDGLPVPLLPEGVFPAGSLPISPDGRLVLAQDKTGAWQWYPIDGGSPVPIAGLSGSSVRVVGWAPDGRSPYVQTSNDVPVVIEIVDFATGRKTPFKTIIPADATGFLSLGLSTMSPDGRQYAFGFSKRISALFVVSHGK